MLLVRVVLGIGIAAVVLIFSFHPQIINEDANAVNIRTDTIISGNQLAHLYCQTCHLFPDPSLLDKKTWLGSVLPNMGWRLGIRDSAANPFKDMLPEEAAIVHSLGVYPETLAISNEEWAKIVAYYAAEAPEKPLPQKEEPPVAGHLSLFDVSRISPGEKPLPQTTLLKFNPMARQLYVGDAQKVLYVLDSNFNTHYTWFAESPPVDIDFPPNAFPRLLTIGEFSPSDQKKGKMYSLDSADTPASTDIYIQSLQRPVQFAAADLNMDKKEDLIVCAFGNNEGQLAWYDNFQTDKEHVLSPMPGARKVVVLDFNRDGKPDIMALMAQAREQLSIFYNEGNGQFSEKKILEFPPVFGVSYFELADFNKDGFPDILLTNGDNWDYSPIPKNYHGIRIYLNDGHNNFSEAWFYPMYGASKAMAGDFDKDGDLDIAAISFYADLDHPEHGFLYLSNEGNLKFNASITPEAADGKWLTMETGDFDGDGDVDIVLGSYYHNLTELRKLLSKGILDFPQLLLLKNNLKSGRDSVKHKRR
ncbi:MAG: VCBS repeat-containing protein [Bacteroidetes bacterium]|nr:VCBS repeat-containing protein [Bacteroidota bacterium]